MESEPARKRRRHIASDQAAVKGDLDGEIETPETLAFQRREWVVERIGWLAMALFIVLGLAGVLGHGVVSRTTAGDPGSPLRIEYDRFARRHAPETITVHLTPPDRQFKLAFSREYLDHVQVERIKPEPTRTELGPDEIAYVFDARSTQPTSVSFFVKIDRAGLLAGIVGLPDGPSQRFRQLVYP